MPLRDRSIRFLVTLSIVVFVGGVTVFISRGHSRFQAQGSGLAAMGMGEEYGPFPPQPSGPSKEAIGRSDGTQEVVVGKCSPSQVPVFMYHHVRSCPRGSMCSEKENLLAYQLSVDPSLFAEQMRYLSEHGYSTILPQELTKRSVDCHSVVLTFDDGYEDNIQNALPVLEQYGFHAGFAVITNRLGQPDYMTPEDVSRLILDGHEIMSHTISHASLPTLSDADLKREIGESRTTLQSMFHGEVSSFVYPSGKYDERALHQTKSAGYGVAFTTKGGVANLKGDLLQLSRIRVSNTIHASFAKVFGVGGKTGSGTGQKKNLSPRGS